MNKQSVRTTIKQEWEQTVHVASGRAWTYSGQWGYTAIVDQDGVVRVWDDLSSYWSMCHALTPRQKARVRRIAFARRRELMKAE